MNQKTSFLSFFLSIIFQLTFGQALVINEIEARNATTIADNKGEYDDWIEIANLSGQSVNLNGYYFTDNPQAISKCKLTATGSELTVPANGYIIFWADSDLLQGTNHLNFKLSGKSGFIGLFTSGLSVVDTLTYQFQNEDVSYGRDINNNLNWDFFPTPTPGKANNTSAMKGICNNPIFSEPSENFSQSLQISLSPANNNDNIRYTLNNSSPNNNSTIYSSPVNINRTEVIRAISVKTGYINSETESQIYFKNASYTMPILAIITDSLNLFGKTGIYTNYDQSGDAWERPCQMKYLVNDSLKAESNMGIRIQGSSSVFMAKKSFRLFFRDAYGNGKFKYPIFGENNLSGFDKLVLKSGYDDDLTMDGGTLLRDALSIELWKRVGGIPQLSSWAILYLNNWYWGIYDVRESIEKSYIMAHTTYTDFDLVRFHNEGPELKHGTMDDWNAMYKFITTTDFAMAYNYTKAKDMIDMDNFLTLLAFVQCSDYYSWPWGISMFKERSSSGKWKFSIWDTDRAYTSTIWNGFDEARTSTDTYFWGNILAKQLMANQEFNDSLVSRIKQFENTVFKAENAIPILDSIYNIVKPEISGEIARWIPGDILWESNVEKFRDFFRKRPGILQSQFAGFLSVNTNFTSQMDFDIYPNPINNNTKISFYLPVDDFTDISIYSPEGILIKSLTHGKLIRGAHEIEWNMNDEFPTGFYIIKFSTPEQTLVKKVIKIK